MGKKGNRRTVLQLSDNKESFLARYGYRRQENEDEDSKGAYDPGDESEDDLEKYAHETLDQDNEQPAELNGKPADIDDKVADFLAEIDALPAPEPDDEEEEEPPPSFKVEIPPPSFKLSSDQQGRYVPPDIDLPKPKEVSTTGKPKYKSMFVKGESEFTRQTETDFVKGVKNDIEEPWPEEPKTVWQQTLDDNTQCFYYWNTVTNEVTWEIPSGYTQYLLKHKEYEATVDRLTKEGRVKPAEEPVKPQSTTSEVISVPEKGNISAVSSTSNVSTQSLPTQKTKETIQPDSTNKAKTTSLVDATYFDDSEDDSSNDSSDDDNEKERQSKPNKKAADSDMDMDLDLDDIDKALEMALEKKKQDDDKGKSKDSKSSREKEKSSKEKKRDKDLKQRTLVDEMKAQVQKRQEVEARRKAAIEEMMARELERRVGPPRKRSSDDEPGSTVWDSKRQKLVEYGHSRKSRQSEHEHSSRRSSSGDHSDSKHKHESRKAEKKKRREEREERRKEKDEKSERKRDRDRSREKDKKDKHKDDKKKDKKDKESRKDDKSRDKSDKKKSEKVEVKEDAKEEEVKIEEIPSIKEEDKPDVKDIPPKADREISKEVELANLKMQASELADLALSKLEFLEVTKKGLSKLQILLIELETRHQDWQGGGLNTEFFIKKLEEANWQLQQYEQSAAPPGWTCHWDRAYRRYFYMNKKSNRTQWDYPDDDDEEEDDAEEENSDKEDKLISQRRNSNEDPNEREEDHVTSKGVSPSPVQSRISSSSSKESDQVTSTTPIQSDVTTTTDSASKISSFMPKQSTNESEDLYLGTNKPQKPGGESTSSEFVVASDLSCLMRGEPPPPGTDLEILLAAPPPPPPPEEGQGNSGSDSDDSADFESGRPFSDRFDREEDMEMDSNEATSSNLQTFSAPSEMSGAVYSPSSDSTVNHGMGNNGFAGIDPGVIARAPQIFSSDAAHGSGDSYYDGKDSGAGYMMPAGQEAGDSAWVGEGGIPIQASEREKKKKKKDKTISSTNLTLKKKNVSSLVQKWQKVKKEVEIEERNREEREMAIRQKLEEWKQEHS